MPKVARTLQQRQDRARVAIKASKRTGDTLPRRIYQLAGTEVPDNATVRTQRAAQLKQLLLTGRNSPTLFLQSGHYLPCRPRSI